MPKRCSFFIAADALVHRSQGGGQMHDKGLN
jgi:hypothetical protein